MRTDQTFQGGAAMTQTIPMPPAPTQQERQGDFLIGSLQELVKRLMAANDSLGVIANRQLGHQAGEAKSAGEGPIPDGLIPCLRELIEIGHRAAAEIEDRIDTLRQV